MTEIKVAKSITASAKVETAIRKAKESLVKRANKSGVYENFGVAESTAIEEKYIEVGNFYNEMLKRRTQVSNFKNWCTHFSLVFA